MTVSKPTPAIWSGRVVTLEDGRLYHTVEYGMRGRVRSTLHPDGRVVSHDGFEDRIAPEAAWATWAYLVAWIDPARHSVRFDIYGEPRPTGRLDQLSFVVMKKGGLDYGMASQNLLAHMRLDPRLSSIAAYLGADE